MTVDLERCLRCSSDRVVAGHLLGGNIHVGFHFGGLRLTKALSGSLSLGGPDRTAEAPVASARACCDCGLVWSDLDATELRFRLREGGTDETRRRLRLDEAPETPEGRPVFPRRADRNHDPAG